MCTISHALLRKPVNPLSYDTSIGAAAALATQKSLRHHHHHHHHHHHQQQQRYRGQKKNEKNEKNDTATNSLVRVVDAVEALLAHPRGQLAAGNEYLRGLIQVARVIISIRTCLGEATITNLLSASDTAAFTPETTSATSNDAELTALSGKYRALVDATPMLGMLCSNEVEHALKDVFERQHIAQVVAELRDASRAVRFSGDEIMNRGRSGGNNGGDSKTAVVGEMDEARLGQQPRTIRGSDAVRALRSAVSAGRRLDLATHFNPRVVAYFTRAELLLEYVDRLLGVLQRGLRDQNVKALRAGLRDAERIGFDSVEVQAARGFLDAAVYRRR